MSTFVFEKYSNSTEEQLVIYSPDSSVASIPQTITFAPIYAFPGGDFSASSILAAARSMKGGAARATPSFGGALTINGNAVGNYEYKVVNSNTTISSFVASEWFSSTEDTVSSWILINGNLTINSGITVIPTVRKLFTVVYVTGNLTSSGTISMTARGANHSGTGISGGYTAPVDIRIGTGTFGAVTNPQIPATGGAGATRRVATTGTSTDDGYNSGTSVSDGGTGGGGGGYLFNIPLNSYAGKGGDGTCFSGGAGSGSVYTNRAGTAVNSDDAGENGGAGTTGIGSSPVGGSGNPRGNSAGGTGTGGVLIIICEGALSGGSLRADGTDTASIGGITGGASGGGSLTVLYGTNPIGPSTMTAAGGTTRGGGNGTVRKLEIGAN